MNRKLSLSLCISLLLLVGVASSQMAHAEPAFSFKIGSLGTANNQLKNPNDVILGSNGNIVYTVDTDNHRIVVFYKNGDYDFKFGSFCDMSSVQNCNHSANGASSNGDGQFNSPSSGVLDSLGNLFVVDSGNERIQRFDGADGKFSFKFGSSDNSKSDFLGSAQGIAIQSSSKKIYVSSDDTDSVSVFDSVGKFLFNFHLFDGNDSFNNPSSMIIDNSDETLYVSDTGNDRIIIFKLVTGTSCPIDTSKVTDGVCFVKKFGFSGTTDGKFNSPSGLALDKTNNLLYVADTDNNRIQTFKLVTGITCPSATNKIADGVCFTEKFGSSGTTDGKFNSPSGLALDKTNNLLYVADTGNHRLQAFSISSSSSSGSLTPDSPKNLKTSPISQTSVVLTWEEPTLSSDVPPVTGYKIEYTIGSASYTTITADTKSKVTSFIHEGLDSSKTYTYQVSAVNSKGTGTPSSSSSVKPAETTVPGGLTATAISPTQIRLSWFPPSNTFGQSIAGYNVEQVYGPKVYDTVGTTNSKTTSYTVSSLTTDKTYSFVVSATIGYGATGPSNTASATPRTNSVDVPYIPSSSTVQTITIPTAPLKLNATSISATQINLSWGTPGSDGNSPITGYKIEFRKDTGSNSTLIDNTNSTATSYSHTNLIANSKYTYKVYAINSAGTSGGSNEASAIPMTTLKMTPLGKISIDEGKPLSFVVKVNDNSLVGLVFSLDKNPPAGAKINANTGLFTWSPTDLQGGTPYVFDIVVTTGALTDRQSITITVNDVLNKPSPEPEPAPTPEPEPAPEPSHGLGLASFVDPTKDPHSYVDRYNKEPNYKKWFDTNFPQYSSIYEAVGLEKPKTDTPNDDTPKVEKKFGICGTGTKLIDGVCTVIKIQKVKPWWQFW